MRPPENIGVNLRMVLGRILKLLDIRSWTEFNRFCIDSCLKGMGYFASSGRKVNSIKIILPWRKLLR